jgi:hypothetical protein
MATLLRTPSAGPHKRPARAAAAESVALLAQEAQELDLEQAERRRPLGAMRGAALSILGFAALWLVFFAFNRCFPYVANGSDIVKLTKKELIRDGKSFPAAASGTKLAIFGDSKVLAGFMPDEFDALAAHDRISVYSYNAGLPAQSEFVKEFAQMADSGAAPDVVLLTIPWQPTPGGVPFFSLPEDDNKIADTLFPFRLLSRNLARFAADAARHGGPLNLYRREKAESDKMLEARGYYYITSLSQFKDNRLPADYTLPTDDPTHVAERKADFASTDLTRLDSVLEKHHIRCYYVPSHLRTTEAAAAPAIDAGFAAMLEQHSSCRAVGPDYFSYSPTFYIDEAHLNEDGARLYTRDLYNLVAPLLGREN